MEFDVIGDIHGCADELAALLNELGYRRNAHNVFCHPTRKVAFLGDFIDRGLKQRAVIDIVKPMVEQGNAIAVMGNHEFNAIAYATKGADGQYLRPHTEKNTGQHQEFLKEYPLGSEDHVELIKWFKTLPLWLEVEGFRLVHACWDFDSMAVLQGKLGSQNCLSEELLIISATKGNKEFDAVEILLKGKELPLPTGVSFFDKDDNPRHHIRVRWWDRNATSYRDAYLGPEEALTSIPEDEIHGDHLIEYSHRAPPVFIGHYWMYGEPQRLAPNIACLDYSVVKLGGKLVAYRWKGEQELINENFIWVNRDD